MKKKFTQGNEGNKNKFPGTCKAFSQVHPVNFSYLKRQQESIFSWYCQILRLWIEQSKFSRPVPAYRSKIHASMNRSSVVSDSLQPHGL